MSEFTDEFRMLRNSAYWQYLPESTRKRLQAILGEDRRVDSRQKDGRACIVESEGTPYENA